MSLVCFMRKLKKKRFKTPPWFIFSNFERTKILTWIFQMTFYGFTVITISFFLIVSFLGSGLRARAHGQPNSNQNRLKISPFCSQPSLSGMTVIAERALSRFSSKSCFYCQSTKCVTLIYGRSLSALAESSKRCK